MGQYFVVVNPVKKQFFNPAVLGERNKLNGIIRNKRTTWVTSLLVTHTDHAVHPLMGAWHGDAVFLAGDEVAPEAGNERNLYERAFAEFDDTSYAVIALLCELDEGTAAALAQQAQAHPRMLVHLGNVVYTVGCAQLKGHLAAVLGKRWEKKYQQALAPSSSP